MKTPLLLWGLVPTILAGAPSAHSEEAHAALYVVDRSPEYAQTEGVGLPYGPKEKAGPSREILGLAKGPPGSTIFMIAFDREAPDRGLGFGLGLGPIIAEQTEESKPVRFPAEGSKWPFEQPSGAVDLYIAVFDKADPDLAKLSEYSQWLSDALKAKNEVEALLHAEVIKKRLNNLLRQRGVEDHRVNYGSELTALREPSSSKAVTTRGSTGVVGATLGKAEPKTPVAAVRRGLKTLDEEWREDSRSIPFRLAAPGILVFPIATPSAP